MARVVSGLNQCGEDGLDESINSGVGVKGSCCFLVGATRVIDEGREVMKVEGDMDGIRAIA